jgi:membrane-bound lytic murein transglycosylase A
MKKILIPVAIAMNVGLLLSSTNIPLESKPVTKSNNTNENQISYTKSSDLLGLDEQLWGKSDQPADRNALLISITNSLKYLQSPQGIKDYQDYQVSEITRERVIKSLVRFRQLILTSKTPEELQNAVRKEFVFYQSMGKDNQGTVLFTAYYEPVYKASRVRTSEYRYPLYRVPPDFHNWVKPHPTRSQLEGSDGLGEKSILKGTELVWLRDRMEAFLVQIQGSAQLQLTDGSVMTVGYSAGTDYPFTSVGRELAKDGKLRLDGMTLPVMIKYFKDNPKDMAVYFSRNQRFIFFEETNGKPATGSIKVPITAERSIATDKSLMPPGALALVHTRLAFVNNTGKIESRLVSRYVLDQDTGSAIKGPGRVDYYMGTGKSAGDRAGVTGGNGKLFYLLLKD